MSNNVLNIIFTIIMIIYMFIIFLINMKLKYAKINFKIYAPIRR